jgi:DNA adenine methylase
MGGVATASAFIKWAGGKQALASALCVHFPKFSGRYFEPFLGGASVFFQLAPDSSVLTDSNAWLVDTYIAIRDDWAKVATHLDSFENTKENYLRIRKIKPESLDLYRRAAQFVYLNKTCFRGLFRVNKKGEFNVPYGAYDRRYYDPQNLELVSKRLQKAEIRTGDFEGGVEGIEVNDFVYFDPPYYKLGGYSDFNRYTATQFRAKDHVRLAAVCNELSNRGIRWAVSNSETSFVRELFTGYRFIPISARREINLKSKDRDIGELLIVNF